MMYRNEKSRKDAVGLKVSVLGVLLLCLGLAVLLHLCKSFHQDELPTRGDGTHLDVEFSSPSVWATLCEQNLSSLYRFVFEGMRREYPSPEAWCDIVSKPVHRESVRWRERVNLPSPVAEHLSCPGAGGGKCSYAMNPACMPNSPPDMVLLFETTDGWNRRGGAELFTFENHWPKGGYVLLNDGTIKFIRTEEELKQLRWR